MSQDQDEGWGWEPFGSEDDAVENIPEGVSPQHGKDDLDAADLKAEKSPQQKAQQMKRINSQSTSNGIGITSSPSFQELERAIGATLASNLSNGDLTDAGNDSKPSPAVLSSRLSSTNLTQKKIQHQRNRQNQFQHQSTPRNVNFANYKYANMQVHQHLNATKAELLPFINEEESRALVIFHSPFVAPSMISEACSKFGVLYYIRPEFHQKGVTFISYFDLQSATTAKMNLPSLATDQECSVHYSIMLHATNSNSEEFRLIIKNLPDGKGEQDVQEIVSRYGPLRSIQKLFSNNEAGGLPGNQTTYTIEYFNIQDARLAASELSATSSTLWGPDIVVKFAPLDDRKQQLCKQLLSTLSKWRTEMANQQNSHSLMPNATTALYPLAHPHLAFPQNIPHNISYSHHHENGLSPWSHMYIGNPAIQHMPQSLPTHESLHPSNMGLYIHPNDPNAPIHPYYFHHPDLDARMVKAPVSKAINPQDKIGYLAGSSEYFSPHQVNHDGRNNSLRKQKAQGKEPTNRPAETEFALDVQRILEGQEKRATIMVRNIPNKYTQQMLLEEVNVNFQGTYDFFYLPIDFKNHCNVGYGFINFVDPKFIPRFVEQFHGQKWKNFNSEKVCAVSFARIQGKSAMISRFQNSSLLEKDDEYKPLLFYSSGPHRGQPEPFPSSNRGFKNSSSDDENGGK